MHTNAAFGITSRVVRQMIDLLLTDRGKDETVAAAAPSSAPPGACKPDTSLSLLSKVRQPPPHSGVCPPRPALLHLFYL